MHDAAHCWHRILNKEDNIQEAQLSERDCMTF